MRNSESFEASSKGVAGFEGTLLRKSVVSILVACGLFAGQAGLCEPANWPGVAGKVSIKASPERVWNAVHAERANDPDLSYSKALQRKDNRVLLEQKFNALPVIGSATCLMVQEETPFKRIDYKLLSSDKFKDMSGSWVLEEQPDGSTILELSSHLDTGLPFSKGIINSALRAKINKRLARVKVAAELPQILGTEPISSP